MKLSSNNIITDLITIEFSTNVKTTESDIHITVDGAKFKALFLQLDEHDIRELGPFPQYNTDILKTNNSYTTIVLNYLINLCTLAQCARIRNAEELLYHKIHNKLYNKDNISDEDIRELVETANIILNASK